MIELLDRAEKALDEKFGAGYSAANPTNVILAALLQSIAHQVSGAATEVSDAISSAAYGRDSF